MRKLYYMFAIFIIFASCKKQDSFLDKKGNLGDIIPATIRDFQAILDNEGIMNKGGAPITYVGTDDYVVSNANYLSVSELERNAYIWNKDIFGPSLTDDIGWNKWYQTVEYANIVLDGLEKINPDLSTQVSFNNVKGAALFFRSFAFYYLINTFAKQYDPITAQNDLGIPIRTSSDINIRSKRESIQLCYDRILADLKNAEQMLPNTLPSLTSALSITRPSVLAAQSLLARVYLSMNDFVNAGTYASKVLASYNKLNDFRTYNSATYRPIPVIPGNAEMIFYCLGQSTYSIVVSNSKSVVNPDLYNLYQNGDLRKLFFYRNDLGVSERRFKGFPTSASNFQGTSVAEMYLIRAESYARNAKIDSALSDLNTLCINRFTDGTFVKFTATNADDVIRLVLTERRRELANYDLVRWTDLRRLNLDPKYATTITRTVNGVTYSLPPNDNRYVYPIPLEEIRLSGMQQNDR